MTGRTVLTLYSPDERDLAQLIDDTAAFALRTGLRIEDGALPPPRVFRTALTNMRSAPEWAALTCMRLYLLDGAVVGSGGAKTAPDEAGEIEIGYGVASAYAGRGLGSEGARQVVADAFALGVRSIVASTLPTNEASWRLLTRLGFKRFGEIIDDDDGLLWCWRLAGAGAALEAAEDWRA